MIGIVSGPGQKPISGANVWLRQGSGAEAEFFGAVADEQGRFEFREVPPGWTNLFVIARGYSYAATRLSLQAGQIATNVSLSVANPQTLLLKLVDDQGQPVDGAQSGKVAGQVAGLDRIGWVHGWLLVCPGAHLNRLKI